MRFERYAGFLASLAALIVVLLTQPVTFHSWPLTGNLDTAGAQTVADSRERVRLSSAKRDEILLEMRTMLQSLSDILHGLVLNDLVKTEKAARASEVIPAVDPSLERELPADFRQLAMRTHKRFGGLADAIKTGATRDAVLRRLAAVTATCVTCHDTYRVDEAR